MSITRRYIIFDELEKEEKMALLDEKRIQNYLIQYVKLRSTQAVEQTNENISVKSDIFVE